MSMLPYRLVVPWFLVVTLGICAAPRPSRGGDFSPEYKASLQRTAELRKANVQRKRAVAMRQRATMWSWSNGGGGGGSFAPEIDAGPAAGAVALLVGGVLMLADRR